MNTKVTFNTTHPPPPLPTTVHFLISSRHRRRLKLGVQLHQTKPNPKKKISQIIFKKSDKNLRQNFKKTTIFKLNTIASRLVFLVNKIDTLQK